MPCHKIHRTPTHALGVTLAIGIVSPIYAQTDARSPQALEEIIVVGEKIERSYLQTFSSVGIVTAEDLAVYDIYDTQDAYRRLANVRAFADPTGGNSISIRGLNADGVTQPANSAALISVVIDGVTQSIEGLKRGSRGLWDVAQIEVHRGPQSTIQGRNSLAGTVVISTKKPTFEPELRLRGLLGDLDRREASFAASGPVIAEQLALRLSGNYSERSNDISVSDPANKPFTEDEFYNIRGRALYTPASIEGLEIDLIYNHSFDAPTSAPVSGPDFFARRFDADSAFAEFREIDTNSYSADIAYELSEYATLRSVSAYFDTSLDIFSAPTSTSFDRADERADSDFTQELRLEIAENPSNFSGVVGLFYGDFERDTTTFVSFNGNLVIQDGTFNNSTESLAAYADFRYRLSDNISLIAGGRYQRDDILNAANFTSSFGEVLIDLPAEFSVFLPKSGVAFELSDNQSLAFTAARGYRQGFSQFVTTRDANGQRTGREVSDVDPEFSWTYDIAYRMTSADGALTLGANIFFNDYSDQQITVSDPVFPTDTVTSNAGDSQSWGLELETSYRLDNGLSVYASLGLLETELGDFVSPTCGNGGSCDGSAYNQAPEVTAALGGNYQHDSGFFASVAANYTGEFFRNIDNADDQVIAGAFLVDTKAGYEFDNYKISVYANNLFDKDYLTGRVSDNQATVGTSRHIGIELEAEF